MLVRLVGERRKSRRWRWKGEVAFMSFSYRSYNLASLFLRSSSHSLLRSR